MKWVESSSYPEMNIGLHVDEKHTVLAFLWSLRQGENEIILFHLSYLLMVDCFIDMLLGLVILHNRRIKLDDYWSMKVNDKKKGFKCKKFFLFIMSLEYILNEWVSLVIMPVKNKQTRIKTLNIARREFESLMHSKWLEFEFLT